MTTKAEARQWLEDRGWHFPDMTDEQKLVMREELNICGYATSSSNRQMPCVRAPSQNGRCKGVGHGGNAPKGINHWNHQGKGTGKYVPAGEVGTLFRQVMEAEVELLNLSESVATLEARRRQLFKATGEYGDPTALSDQLVASYEKLLKAKQSFDNEKLMEAIREIGDTLESVEALAKTWEQLLKVDDQKRKHVETETRRREKMREIVTAEDALAAFRDLSMANAEAIMQCPHLTAEQRKELRREVAERFADRFGMADVSGIIQQALTAVGE